MSKRLILLVSFNLLFGFLTTQTVAGDTALEGEWFGGLTSQNGESSYDMKIYFLKQKGQLRATLDLPSYQSFDLPFSEINLNGDEIELKRQSTNGDEITLSGKIQNDIITGRYSRNARAIGIFQLIKSNSRIIKHTEIPDFEVSLLDRDQVVSKSSLKGKYYMLDFWSTSCSICVEEMPNLHEVFEKYRSANFAMISLSLDQSVEKVRKFRASRWQMPWQNVYLSEGFDSAIAKNLQVRGTPTGYLVSPDGIILATTSELTGENLEKTLARYLEKR
ncbi:TlpA family protein disulfide reductase [bacterium]|nr:TlpA family protein disulfide reductase [bacterium]